MNTTFCYSSRLPDVLNLAFVAVNVRVHCARKLHEERAHETIRFIFQFPGIRHRVVVGPGHVANCWGRGVASEMGHFQARFVIFKHDLSLTGVLPACMEPLLSYLR